MLKTWKSLKPNPLAPFCWHNFFWPIQWILVSSFHCLQKNCVINCSRLAHSYFGNLKQLMVNARIDIITASINISLPPYDNNFRFHPCSFCHTWYLISKNASAVSHSINGGDPNNEHVHLLQTDSKDPKIFAVWQVTHSY